MPDYPHRLPNLQGVGLNIVEDPTSSSGLRILGLVLGSPSASGGVRQGDELLEIDGRPVKGLGSFAASSSIQGEPGTPVSVRVRHADGQEQVVVMKRGGADAGGGGLGVAVARASSTALARQRKRERRRIGLVQKLTV